MLAGVPLVVFPDAEPLAEADLAFDAGMAETGRWKEMYVNV